MFYIANDRSRSPTSQRGASPARPPPPSTSQQQEEPELKMAKDTDGPIPMPPPASFSSSSSSPPPPAPPTQSADPYVSSTDTGTAANAAPPPPEPVRDPDTIALEKLEQIKQSLDSLENEVDAFTGSTRNERAYKILDEQALKIMIRCDELVDVSADIKEKRKEMVRNVERVIGKLESKVPTTPVVEENRNQLGTAGTYSNESSSAYNNEDNNEKKSSPSSSLSKQNRSSSRTEEDQSIST